MEARTGSGSRCPYDWYRELRRSRPVAQLQPGMFAVTRCEDVRAVLADPKTFSARVGGNNSFALFGPSTVQDQLDEIMRVYPEEPVLMRTDPPSHTRVRNLVNRALTPAEVEKIEPQIQAIVDELAAPWIRSGSVEFVSAFAALLPNAVTTNFLGAPTRMREKLRFWAAEVMSRFGGPQPPERQLEVARHIAEMGRYFLDEIAARRRQPNADLISLLAHAEIDGDRLEDVAIVNVIETFLIGGHETTTFLLGNSLLHLAQRPDIAGLLRTETARIPQFVEEMLRLEAPAQSVQRSATRDVEIGGVQIPAGSILFVFLASANRDEALFEDPDTLKLGRVASTSTRHVAFGYGSHACLGLHLARAEARIALRTLLPHMSDITLAPGSPVSRVENWLLRGPSRLELRFSPT
jgi:cytochrome P450